MTTAHQRHTDRPETHDVEAALRPELPPPPAAGPARHRGLRAVNVLVSAIALAAVAVWVSRQQAPTLPSGPTAFLLAAAAVGVHACTMVLRGWRWHGVLVHSGIRHRRVDAYALVAVGYMGNTVLPARGGEVLRTLLLRARSSGGRREILGTIVAERLLDVVALVALLALVTVAGAARTAIGWAPAVLGIVALAAGSAGAAFYLRLRRRGAFERFARIVRPFARASKVLASGWGARLLAVSLVIWTMEGCIFALAGASLDLDISVLEGLFLVVLANFFALIPAAPGYVGTYDAAILFGTQSLAVAGRDAIGLAVLARVISFVPVTIAGLVLLVTRYGGLRRLKEAS